MSNPKPKRIPLKQKIEWIKNNSHLWYNLDALAEKSKAEGIYSINSGVNEARSGLHALLMRYFNVDSRKLNGTEPRTKSDS